MNETSKKIIREVNMYLNNSSCIINNTDYSIEYQGYYVHKLLAIQIARWVSTSFFIKVSNTKDVRIFQLEFLLNKQIETNGLLVDKYNNTLDDLKYLIIRSNKDLESNEELLYDH